VANPRRAPFVLVAVALVIIVSVILAVNLAKGSAPSQSAASSGTSQAPQNTASPSPMPTRVGLVSIDSGITSDPRAAAVATMFNAYFSGVNHHDWTHALSVFDPNGQMNPNDSNMVNNFANGDATTTDSSITVTSIQPSSGGPAGTAEVTFQSRQAPGYGPSDNPSETCTQWDITYQLAQSSSGTYLIHAVQSASDSGC
jgi:hypothetical protein